MTRLPPSTRMPRPQRDHRDRTHRDRGLSTAVEAAIVVPVLVLVMGVMTAGFRIWQTRAELQQTASAAARAASLARTAPEARSRIAAVVSSNAGTCRSPMVTSDLGAFSTPPGTPARVEVQIRCTITLGDLLLPGLPGTTTVTVSAAAPLDTYRRRSR